MPASTPNVQSVGAAPATARRILGACVAFILRGERFRGHVDARQGVDAQERHRLPDDGNKYELIRGELFVTPPPSVDHEQVLARLSAILTSHVAKHSLGRDMACGGRRAVGDRGGDTVRGLDRQSCAQRRVLHQERRGPASALMQ